MKRFLTLSIALSCCLLLIAGTIDLNVLLNYSNQAIPAYINKDNTPPNNQITDAGATLGRVLFYDKKLSVNNTIACASCHMQQFGFSDTATVSTGLYGGFTGRHSMRLINARFGNEVRFFWDERATSLEDQTTQPIQDHVEMGFSGQNGDPDFDSLIRKMEEVSYYRDLFPLAFGDSIITEDRISRALAQFIRSIQSFDSRYDIGRAQVNNNNVPFPNFTPQENQGKMLFMAPLQNGGANCNGCHNAPEFDINPNINGNNGVISVAGDPNAVDLTNRKSPTLRDLVRQNGELNGPMMHDGSFTSLLQVIEHYNLIVNDPAVNPNLAVVLGGGPNGPGQNLQLTQGEKNALVAFLETLAGSNVYSDDRWSDPFDANGYPLIDFCIPGITFTSNISFTTAQLNWEAIDNAASYQIRGRTVGTSGLILINQPSTSSTLSVTGLIPGTSYEWEYRVICDTVNQDDTSTWSGFETFTTLDCSGVPSPIFTTLVTSSTVRLNWTIVPNSAGYQIYGRQLGGPLANLIVVGGNTSFKDITGLTPGNSYEWSIRSLCDGGAYSSDFTERDTFLTPGTDFVEEMLTATPLDVPISPGIFPNPFMDQVHIQCDCDMIRQLVVYNIAGQKLFEIETRFDQDQVSLSLGHLTTGVYLLYGFDDKGEIFFSEKIIKNNY